MAGRHSKPLRRSAPKREPRRSLLILCEGQVTEPRYFRDFKNEHRNQLVEVNIISQCGAPKTLVEAAVERKKWAEREARRYRDPYRRYDEIWCVFDVDSHPNLEEAKNQARDNKLKLAISNPCFELWVLLHFQEQRAYQERGWMQSACRKHVPGFVKEIPYGRLQPNYQEAVERAKLLVEWQAQQGRPGGNPSTSVYKLTETIAELGRERFLRQTAIEGLGAD